ncbi:unnamed protein product, partial [Heterosigma akashiwo]
LLLLRRVARVLLNTMQANAKISPGESHAEDGASGGGEAVTPVVKNATIKQMFQYADGQDYILMAIGSIH